MKRYSKIKFADVAFKYRMGAGFQGDVNRMHPAEIEAALILASSPPTAYGQFVMVNATGNAVRPLAATEQSNTNLFTPFGVTVRPFPLQTPQGAGNSQGLGVATPPVTGVIDVLRNGMILTILNDVTQLPVKGQSIWIWCAATSGVHTQGGIEVTSSAGNTVQLDSRYTFNGPPDANGIVEISVNV